jgi:hypothetical protein
VASLLFSWAFAFVVFYFAARAVRRRWVLAAPVLLGAIFLVLLVVNGPGDTAVGFLVVWLVLMVGSAEAGAWIGLGERRDR